MGDGNMAPNRGFAVTSDELLAHARTVGELAADLDRALSLAEGVALDQQAYGAALSAVAAAIAGIGGEGVATLRDGVEALNTVVTDLRATAHDYSEHGDRGRVAFNRIDEPGATG